MPELLDNVYLQFLSKLSCAISTYVKLNLKTKCCLQTFPQQFQLYVIALIWLLEKNLPFRDKKAIVYSHLLLHVPLIPFTQARQEAVL